MREGKCLGVEEMEGRMREQIRLLQEQRAAAMMTEIVDLQRERDMVVGKLKRMEKSVAGDGIGRKGEEEEEGRERRRRQISRLFIQAWGGHAIQAKPYHKNAKRISKSVSCSNYSVYHPSFVQTINCMQLQGFPIDFPYISVSKSVTLLLLLSTWMGMMCLTQSGN